MKHFVKWTLLALVAMMVLSVQADTLIKMKEGTGKPGADGKLAADALAAGREVQIWSRLDNMARVDATGKMIFSIDRGITYMISNANKTCSEFKHPEKTRVESTGNDALEVKKTGDNRQIGSWQAEGYSLVVSVEGMQEPLEVLFWVSDEVTSGLDTYRNNFGAMATPQTAWMSKTLELGGYPVYQESRIGQMMMWSEVLSVSEEDAPDGIYDVPEGYTGCSAD